MNTDLLFHASLFLLQLLRCRDLRDVMEASFETQHPETYSALNNHRPFIVCDCDQPFIDRSFRLIDQTVGKNSMSE